MKKDILEAVLFMGFSIALFKVLLTLIYVLTI